MIVTNPTTPANYFHLLRRQVRVLYYLRESKRESGKVHRSYNKPLIVMSPKFLHHHTPCTSQLSEMEVGTYFRRMIVDKGDSSLGRHDQTHSEEVCNPLKVPRRIYENSNMLSEDRVGLRIHCRCAVWSSALGRLLTSFGMPVKARRSMTL